MYNIYEINKKNIQKAKELLKKGELIAIPTETVYGLCADATNEKAIEKLFKIKNRPYTNPINIIISDKKDIGKYAYVNNDIEKKLIKYFLPGSITIILQKKDIIQDKLVAGKNKIGIRVTNLEVIKQFLKGINYPLALPSANPSGKPPPTNAKDVYNYFGENIPMILDGGKCSEKQPSTICEVINGKIKIRRKGPITKQDIINKLGNIELYE